MTDTETRIHEQPRVLVEGLRIGESPRWHDGRLWVCNWGAAEVVAVAADGSCEPMLSAPAAVPFSIDWLPDGRLLLVSGRVGQVARLHADGSLAPYADLNAVSDRPWNEIVVDGREHVYVNGIGFDLMSGERFSPGIVALVEADGSARPVADGMAFPNGMAVTPDNKTLVVAESYANRLTAFDILTDGTLAHRRVWADLGDGVPDGICIDADGAVWYADVPNGSCVRVAAGGRVLQRFDLERACFACMLGGTDGATLFMLAAEWRGPDAMFDGERTGQVLAASAPAPRAGWP